MNRSYHQYSKRFFKIRYQYDNESYRFQDFYYDHSPFFGNFFEEQDYSIEFYKGNDVNQEATGDITKEQNRKKRKGSSESQQLISIECDQQNMNLRQQVFQGGKNDTMELCINFKTMIVSFFRERQGLNELNQQQINHLNQFSAQSPSLKSLTLFFKPSSVNRYMVENAKNLFGSSQCMKRILKSRCKPHNKLLMIKFIERMRMNSLKNGEITKWKDDI